MESSVNTEFNQKYRLRSDTEFAQFLGKEEEDLQIVPPFLQLSVNWNSWRE